MGKLLTVDDVEIEFEKQSEDHACKWCIYVRVRKKYKHQWDLIDAVSLLRKEGISIELHLIGGGDPQALHWMKESIQRN